MFLQKDQLTSNGLQGVISQKIELYITTAVRTLNHTYFKYVEFAVMFFFNSHSGGLSPSWVHSARRSLNGLLYLPRVIMMMENLVE
jgi:hypothetical protein